MATEIRSLAELAKAGRQEGEFVRALVATYWVGAHEVWVTTVRDCKQLRGVDGNIRTAEATAMTEITERLIGRGVWQPRTN